MTHRYLLPLTLALLLGASCSKNAPAPSTPAPQTEPAAAAPAQPSPDEQARKVTERIAEYQAAHEAELARWTPELKAEAAALVETRFEDPETALNAVVGGPQRAPENVYRDAYRHPAQTLAFFGIEPDMTVVELGAGGGWYTEILAPLLAREGTLRAVSYDPEGDPTSMRTAYGKRFEMFLSRSPELYGNVEAIYATPPHDMPLGAPGSADMVLAMREMHNWHRRGELDAYLVAIHEVLKDGGTFGVVQHRAPEGADADVYAKKGYLPQAWLVDTVEAAGFELVESTELNANPDDTKDYEDGVWTLPPNFRRGDVDRAKYEAIGESDRMTLRFKKVAKS